MAAPDAGMLFVQFAKVGLSGFGGCLPWAQRALVEQLRWLDQKTFTELLGIAQVLPGPNVCNLALIVGTQFAGWRGAAAALGGLLFAPCLIVMALGAAYAHFGHQPQVHAALSGMASVGAGLLLASALSLLRGLSGRRADVLLAMAACSALGVLGWSLWLVLAVLVPAALALHAYTGRCDG